MNDNNCLNSPVFLNIEAQVTTSLNYSKIIEDFGRTKIRSKIKFLGYYFFFSLNKHIVLILLIC